MDFRQDRVNGQEGGKKTAKILLPFQFTPESVSIASIELKSNCFSILKIGSGSSADGGDEVVGDENQR